MKNSARLLWCLVPLLAALTVRDRFALLALALASAQALFVASWDLLGGVSGQPSLAHTLALGAGGYTAAWIAALHLAPAPAALVAGGVAGGLIGAGQGLACARMNALALMIVTLAMGEAAREVLPLAPLGRVRGILLGGANGIPAAPYPSVEADAARAAAAVLAAGVLCLGWLSAVRPGLTMRLARDDPRAAAASGIRIERTRICAFVIAAAFAGVAGAVQALILGRASPALLSLGTNGFAMGVAGIAGPGTIIGPALGAYALTAGMEWLDLPPGARLPLDAALLVVAGAIAPLGRAQRGSAARGGSL